MQKHRLTVCLSPFSCLSSSVQSFAIIAKNKLKWMQLSKSDSRHRCISSTTNFTETISKHRDHFTKVDWKWKRNGERATEIRKGREWGSQEYCESKCAQEWEWGRRTETESMKDSTTLTTGTEWIFYLSWNCIEGEKHWFECAHKRTYIRIYLLAMRLIFRESHGIKIRNARCALTIRWITNDHLSFFLALVLVHVICFYWVRSQMCFDQPYCSIFFFSFWRHFYLLCPQCVWKIGSRKRMYQWGLRCKRTHVFSQQFLHDGNFHW